MHFCSYSVPKLSLLRVVLVLPGLLWSKITHKRVGFGNLFYKLALEFNRLSLSGFIGDLFFGEMVI